MIQRLSPQLTPWARMLPAPTPNLFLFDRPAAEDEDHYVPDNDRIRILAMSVANENPAVKPAQLLYDELPSLRSPTNCRPGSLT
jgi:hypothetical protein